MRKSPGFPDLQAADRTGMGTRPAQTGELQAMADDMELMQPADAIANVPHLFERELDNPLTSPADEMVMRFFAESDFIASLHAVESHLFQNAAIHEERERTVHCGLANGALAARKSINDPQGVEMTVKRQHGVQYGHSRGRKPDSAHAKKVSEGVQDSLIPRMTAIQRHHPILESSFLSDSCVSLESARLAEYSAMSHHTLRKSTSFGVIMD